MVKRASNSGPPERDTLFSSDPDQPAHKRNADPGRKAQTEEVRNRIGGTFTEGLHRHHRRPVPSMYGKHFGTGAGKTHWASTLTTLAEKYNLQLIFVTSTRALVEQVRAKFDKSLAGSGMRAYVSFGREDQWSDDIIAHDASQFLKEIRHLEKRDPASWKHLESEYQHSNRKNAGTPIQELMAKTVADLRLLQRLVRDVGMLAETDERIERSLRERRAQLAGTLTKLCRLITRVDVRSKFTLRHAPVTAPLCRRLFPLDYVLHGEPGPIIMTHDKWVTGPDMATRSVPKEKRPNGLPTPPTHVAWTHLLNTVFERGTLLIVDEEEEHYITVFNKLNAKLDSPQTWFPTITSLSLYLLWDMFLTHQSCDRSGWQQLLFDQLEPLVANIRSVEASIGHYKAGRIAEVDAKAALLEALAVRCTLSDPAIEKIFELLVDAWRRPRTPATLGNLGDTWGGLEYYENCWKSVLLFRKFIDHHGLYADIDNERERWRRFYEVVSKKHRLVIRKSQLSEIDGHLQYLFFDEELRLVDQEMLKHIFVRIVPDNGDLELLYRPNGQEANDLFNLAVLLRLLLWTAIVVSGQTLRIPAPQQEVDPPDEDYVKQINALKRTFTSKAFGLSLLEATAEQMQAADDKIVDDDLIFELAKGFFTISVDRQTVRSDDYLSAYFSVSALGRSPESLLLATLFGPGGKDAPSMVNIVISMSATAGIGNPWEFDRDYIDGEMTVAGGVREGFTAEHEEITRLLRELSPRTVEVGFFEDGTRGRLMRVDKVNHHILATLLPQPVLDPRYRSNLHKQRELRTFFDAVAYLAQRPGPHAGMMFTQTTRYIKAALEGGLAQGALGVRRADRKLAQVYAVDPAAIGMRTENNAPLVIVLFEARFLQRRHFEDIDERASPQLELDGGSGTGDEEGELELTEEDVGQLQHALDPHVNLDRNKVLFVSRYISAERGLSIHSRQKIDGKVVRRDFDFIVLANHRYYDNFLRTQDGRGATMEKLMAAAKKMRRDGALGLATMTDIARELYERPRDMLSEAATLEHFTNVIQSSGRLDRGQEYPRVQRLFVNADYVGDIVDGNLLSGGFDRRASKTAYTLIVAAQDYHCKRSPRIPDFDTYVREEVALAMSFLEAVNRLKGDVFNNHDPGLRRAACEAWSALRNSRAATDPCAYLMLLDIIDWPYGRAHRRHFNEYLYAAADAFGGDPRFFRWAETGRTCLDEPIRVISDYRNSPNGQLYRPVEMLFRRPLLDGPLTSDYARLCFALGYASPSLFHDDLPRPHFLVNFVKGIVGETLIEEALRQHAIEILSDAWAIERGVFEYYDTYCRLPSGKLCAIDGKHWSRNADRHLSNHLRYHSVVKAKEVRQHLEEEVAFLYMNTFGGSFMAPCREPSADIEYISLLQNDRDPGAYTQRFSEIFDA